VLLEQKRFALAVTYSAGSLLTGLAAVFAGIRLGRMI
jgi:fluoride ion exporter CrcB/FEX